VTIALYKFTFTITITEEVTFSLQILRTESIIGCTDTVDVKCTIVCDGTVQMCQLMRKDVNTLSFKLKEVAEELRTFKDKVSKTDQCHRIL